MSTNDDDCPWDQDADDIASAQPDLTISSLSLDADIVDWHEQHEHVALDEDFDSVDLAISPPPTDE